MSLKYYLLFLLYMAFNRFQAQTLVPAGQIGQFNSASSFSINPAGYLYIADSGNNEIVKLDTLGNVIKKIGGYGWSESSFDNPADIFANTLNVYVSDKNNNRVQFFDKDLNFISQFSNQNSNDEASVFRYPAGCAVSNQGDIFILDSDNNRIIKFNSRGEFQAAIGSFDAGQYALTSPKQFAIADSKIIVIDSKRMIVFDHFGNGIKIVPLEMTPSNLNSSFGNISLTDGAQTIFFNETNLQTGIIFSSPFNPRLDEEIMDSLVFNRKLYLLIRGSILIYDIINQN
ncbi:MAG: NHL repeat-containing protein [Melioribacteraceae bacterium]